MILKMSTKGLVDGLNITSKKIEGRCEEENKHAEKESHSVRQADYAGNGSAGNGLRLTPTH